MRTIRLTAVVAILVAATGGAFALGKPQSGATALLTFDDLAGDAIRSDLRGPYDATLDGEFLMLSTTKRRALRLDFSTCASGPCDGPFKDTLVDTVSVTMSVHLHNGNAWLEFNSAGKHWELLFLGLEITPTLDGSGQVAGYLIEDTGAVPARLYEVAAGGYRSRKPLPVERGRYVMPWGATLLLP